MIVIGTTAFSQTIEERVEKLENDVETLKEINTTLKSNYKLFKGEQMTRVDEVEIKFIKTTGDKYGKTVTVELLVTNLGESKKTNGKDFKILDELGNEYSCDKMEMGSEAVWKWVMTYKDAPVKVKLTFNNVPESTVYVRRINLIFTTDIAFKQRPVSLDGSQIGWE